MSEQGFQSTVMEKQVINQVLPSHEGTTNNIRMASDTVIKDAERFRFIAESERTVAGGKWCVQVISAKGNIYTAYFAKPPAGTPETIYPNTIEALRAAIDEAMLESNES